MLFADADQAQANAASWIAIAMAGITMLGGVANLIINKWSDRGQAADKLANETEKIELRSKVMLLEERQKACLEGHGLIADKLKHCEEEHHQSGLDRSKIWAELNAIKSGTAAATAAGASAAAG